MSSKSQTSMPVSAQDAGIVVSACFPPAARVRAKAEFDRVFEAGKRTAEPLLALHRLDDGAPSRLGLAVSRKVDARAVGRNRIKRVLRDTFRRHRALMPARSFVVVARPAAAKLGNTDLANAFIDTLRRAGSLPRPGATGTMRGDSLSPNAGPSLHRPDPSTP